MVVNENEPASTTWPSPQWTCALPTLSAIGCECKRNSPIFFAILDNCIVVIMLYVIPQYLLKPENQKNWLSLSNSIGQKKWISQNEMLTITSFILRYIQLKLFFKIIYLGCCRSSVPIYPLYLLFMILGHCHTVCSPIVPLPFSPRKNRSSRANGTIMITTSPFLE